MLRIRLFLAYCLLPVAYCIAQPKLVVGIVVDQMRGDYIEKYWDKFGDDGFKRLVNEGYNCKNTHYNYVPTFTGPGHASIYTGCTPSVHGIVSNDWIMKSRGKKMYCAADSSVLPVGTKDASGKMSPRNLLAPTVGEILRKSNKNASKVIGIALKDRGAILPAGHKATAAYWYDGKSGNWISSSYYMSSLPAWVAGFNKKSFPKTYLSQPWSTLLPIGQYTESDADNNDCEEPFKGMTQPVFPYDLSSLMAANGGLGLLRSTPFGNTFTLDFAKETIRNEKLGKGAASDMLCMSLSSADYIGHQFGPQSVEVEDCYLRLDLELAAFLKFLDEWVGKEHVLVFLTSDHGAAEALNCSRKKGLAVGSITEKAMADTLKGYFARTLKDTLRVAVADFDVYIFNKKKASSPRSLPEGKMWQYAAARLAAMNGVAGAFTRDEIQSDNFLTTNDSIRAKVKAGFFPARSGDVTFVLKPGWLQGYEKGTSHGSPYHYDTHVPLLWWGYSVQPGSTAEAITITQIAPTLSGLLKIQKPDGCVASPVMLPEKQ